MVTALIMTYVTGPALQQPHDQANQATPVAKAPIAQSSLLQPPRSFTDRDYYRDGMHLPDVSTTDDQLHNNEHFHNQRLHETRITFRHPNYSPALFRIAIERLMYDDGADTAPPTPSDMAILLMLWPDLRRADPAWFLTYCAPLFPHIYNMFYDHTGDLKSVKGLFCRKHETDPAKLAICDTNGKFLRLLNSRRLFAALRPDYHWMFPLGSDGAFLESPVSDPLPWRDLRMHTAYLRIAQNAYQDMLARGMIAQSRFNGSNQLTYTQVYSNFCNRSTPPPAPEAAQLPILISSTIVLDDVMGTTALANPLDRATHRADDMTANLQNDKAFADRIKRVAIKADQHDDKMALERLSSVQENLQHMNSHLRFSTIADWHRVDTYQRLVAQHHHALMRQYEDLLLADAQRVSNLNTELLEEIMALQHKYTNMADTFQNFGRDLHNIMDPARNHESVPNDILVCLPSQLFRALHLHNQLKAQLRRNGELRKHRDGLRRLIQNERCRQREALLAYNYDLSNDRNHDHMGDGAVHDMVNDDTMGNNENMDDDDTMGNNENMDDDDTMGNGENMDDDEIAEDPPPVTILSDPIHDNLVDETPPYRGPPEIDNFDDLKDAYHNIHRLNEILQLQVQKHDSLLISNSRVFGIQITKQSQQIADMKAAYTDAAALILSLQDQIRDERHQVETLTTMQTNMIAQHAATVQRLQTQVADLQTEIAAKEAARHTAETMFPSSQ